MVGPLVVPIAYGIVTAASIIGPPIIKWIGDQTWNKQSADNESKLAEAAAFDQKQREEAAKTGYNPYTQQTQTSSTGGMSDIMNMMMPMMMMMFMLPMMQGMFSNKKQTTDES